MVVGGGWGGNFVRGGGCFGGGFVGHDWVDCVLIDWGWLESEKRNMVLRLGV